MELIAQIDQTALGMDYYVRLYDDHLEIKKTIDKGQIIERSIPLFDIESVKLKVASGFLGNGLIQFIIKDENKGLATFINQQFRDDCMVFKKKFNIDAQQIMEYIDCYD